MSHAAKKVTTGELGFDVTRARLIRRGPRGAVRFSLRALRESAGKTQTQVARASGLAQPDVSKLEGAATLDDRQVSTLRRYLGALGDELELVSVSKHGHRIGVVGAQSSKHAAEDDSPSFTRLQELVAEVRNVVDEREPFREGINVDNWGLVVGRTLGAIVNAACVRWKEPSSKNLGTPATLYRRHLTLALLCQAEDAFSNEANHHGNQLARDIRAMLTALRVAWERGDEKALRKPSRAGRRDSPMSWLANYSGRPTSPSENRAALVAALGGKWFTLGGPKTVDGVVMLAVIYDCVHQDKADVLRAKLAKYVERNGWPDDDVELVEKLLRLAGQRDPLNTLRKRQRRRDRAG